jgi:RNA recognition motif-containing protein
MKSKLYVGNLSFEVKDGDLTTLFATCGTVQSVNIIKDMYTGKVRGFGFVEMNNQLEANKAVDTINSTEFMGRTVKVSLANEREEKRPFRY